MFVPYEIILLSFQSMQHVVGVCLHQLLFDNTCLLTLAAEFERIIVYHTESGVLQTEVVLCVDCCGFYWHIVQHLLAWHHLNPKFVIAGT